MVKPIKKIKRKNKNVITAVAHISSTFNNTIITISDMQGNVIASSSSGAAGFKNSKKSTPYAASMAAEKVSEVAKECGVRFLLVHLKGPGSGREAAVNMLHSKGFSITAIRDITPLPHNGCRPPKVRRS